MGQEVEITVASDTRWLRLLRHVVEDFGSGVGLDSKECSAVILAVGEAVTNVIKHSYKGQPDKKVSLSLHEYDGAIEIEVRDEGESFDAVEQPVPPPDELRAGGRGLFLIRTIMDEVEYRRQGTTNCVRMKKFLKTHAQ